MNASFICEISHNLFQRIQNSCEISHKLQVFELTIFLYTRKMCEIFKESCIQIDRRTIGNMTMLRQKDCERLNWNFIMPVMYDFVDQ